MVVFLWGGHTSLSARFFVVKLLPVPVLESCLRKDFLIC